MAVETNINFIKYFIQVNWLHCNKTNNNMYDFVISNKWFVYTSLKSELHYIIMVVRTFSVCDVRSVWRIHK